MIDESKFVLQEVCSKVVTFEEKEIHNLLRGSCKWVISAWKIEIFCKIA